MVEPLKLQHSWNRAYMPVGGVERAFLLLELNGVENVQADRAPINVSLVLDRSGSMSGKPLAFSKKACEFVVDQMSGADLLSEVRPT